MAYFEVTWAETGLVRCDTVFDGYKIMQKLTFQIFWHKPANRN